ncbi:MAG: hypothetical protein NTU78_05435 [Alphaproteobacteria bacterium]|nr:hypothetical protein [Alphaproteobacteria bacterium]
MITLNRRELLLGLTAITTVALLPTTLVAQSTVPILLGRRRIPLSSESLTFIIKSPLDADGLVIRTKASGYWLYGIDVIDAGGAQTSHHIGRRILPGHDFEVQSLGTEVRSGSMIVLRHSYLPLSSSSVEIELWGNTV